MLPLRSYDATETRLIDRRPLDFWRERNERRMSIISYKVNFIFRTTSTKFHFIFATRSFVTVDSTKSYRWTGSVNVAGAAWMFQ